MDTRPIGMFDSGVGGMTVFKEVVKILPKEEVVYLGDTLRFPYGPKSKESIIDLTKKGIEFLISKNVKCIIIACGTATSQALEEVKREYDIPVIGIIEPTVTYLKHTTLRKIGVIATSGTIRSNAWQKEILTQIPDAIVENKACPMLAPMAEEGWTKNQIAKLAIEEYLKDMPKIDSLILGCTHYPLFTTFIKQQLGETVEIINTGEKVAIYLKDMLRKIGKENEKENPKHQIYLTDTQCNFKKIVYQLLGDSMGKIEIQKA